MSKKFVKIIERNVWEGESWSYYIESDSKLLNKIKKHLSKGFVFRETLIDEEDVDKVCKNTECGYMNYHNKVIGYKKNTDNPDNPLYKGGCLVFQEWKD